MEASKPADIRQRTFDFAIRVVKLIDALPHSVSSRTVAKQLVRSRTSIGANVEEDTAASSKNDFTHKMNIALKEARETHYWLRIILESKMAPPNGLDATCREAEELTKILGAIVRTSRKNSRV